MFNSLTLQFYIINKALYYVPLLNSNKTRTWIIQSLINTGILWCPVSFHNINNEINKLKNALYHKDYIKRNPIISAYALS